MPQIQVFQCPSCGANLSYDGGPEITFACQFCGTSVVVPEEMRPHAPAQAAPPAASGGMIDPGAGMGGGLPLDKLAEMKRLAQAGQKIEAIKIYREITGVGLREAKDAVEQLAAGQPVVLASSSVEMSGMTADQAAMLADQVRRAALAGGSGLTQDKLDEMKRLVQAGQKIEAIKIFRQTTGVGLREAKDAVEGWDVSQPQAYTGSPAGISGGAMASPRPGTARARRTGLATACGCALFLGVPILLFTGIIWAVNSNLPLRLSGSYTQALEAAQSNAEVIAALGAPVQPEGWPSNGYVSCSGNACTAFYLIHIRGSKTGATINVRSHSTEASFLNEGTWVLDAEVDVDNRGPKIRLGGSPAIPGSSNVQPTRAPTRANAQPTLSSPDLDATAGAESRSTQRAKSTAVAAQATQTRAAVRAATGTAAAEVTAAAKETAVAQATAQAVMAAQAGWPVVFSDSFANNQLGWPTGLSEDDNYSITTTVKAKKFAWSVVPKQGAYANAFPLNPKPYGDFSASVKVKFVQGGEDGNLTAGLVFRHADQDYGLFGIDPNGNFHISLAYPSTGLQDNVTDQSAALHTGLGQVNQLTVHAIGPDFIFVINDQVVGQLTLDLPKGDFGVGVDAADQGDPVSVEFTEFAVQAPKK